MSSSLRPSNWGMTSLMRILRERAVSAVDERGDGHQDERPPKRPRSALDQENGDGRGDHQAKRGVQVNAPRRGRS